MKAPSFLLLFVSLLTGFSQSEGSYDIDCESRVSVENCEIGFDFGKARKLRFSSYDKDKLLMQFWRDSLIYLEYDILNGEQRNFSAKKDRDQFAYPAERAQVLFDKTDSIIWYGNHAQLKCYNLKIDSVNSYPIGSVHHIAKYRDKLYFFAASGVYIKKVSDQSPQIVASLQIPYFKSARKLDKETVILNEKLTYDLKTDTWREGIHLYSKQFKDKFFRYKARDGIAVFTEEDNHYCSTAKGVDTLNFGKRVHLQNIRIVNPFVYYLGKGEIQRYDIRNQSIRVFRFYIPKDGRGVLSYRFDRDIVWMHRAGQLHFLDQTTGLNYEVPLDNREEFRDFEYDHCNVYLFYDSYLRIEERETFLNSIPVFDKSEHFSELKRFQSIVASNDFMNQRNVDEAIKGLQIIQERYADSEHPDIIRILEDLKIRAFAGLQFESEDDFIDCIKNVRIIPEKRLDCLFQLMRRKARDGLPEYVVKLADENSDLLGTLDSRTEFSTRVLFRIPDQRSAIEVYRKHLTKIDSISQLIAPADKIAYEKALALKDVCMTSFFEGEGGYNFDLFINTVRNCRKQFPNSLYGEKAEIELIRTEYCDMCGSQYENAIEDLFGFLRKYPNSENRNEALYNAMTWLDPTVKTIFLNESLLDEYFKYVDEFFKGNSQSYLLDKIEHYKEKLGR